MLRAKRSTHRQPRHLGVRRARYIIPEESLLRPGVNKCRRLSGVCWIRAIERPPELVAKARLGVAEGRARRGLPPQPHTGAEHLRLNASVSGALRGTEGSNPSPSSGESAANLTSSIRRQSRSVVSLRGTEGSNR